MTIKEISELTALSADTLRYYERIGLIPPVKRNASGIRCYDDTDKGWIEFIKCMRSAGLPIEVLIDYVSLFQQGDATKKARKEILQEQRELLAERVAQMQATLAKLDMKIAKYDKECFEYEQKLQETLK